MKQGVKAIVLTNGNEFIVVNVSADKRVDVKKVLPLVGWSRSKTRMATSDEVLEKTGCEIGSVPPFGHRENLRIFLDRGVYDNEMNAFNIGLRTHSVKIKTQELKKVFKILNLEEGVFATS